MSVPVYSLSLPSRRRSVQVFGPGSHTIQGFRLVSGIPWLFQVIMLALGRSVCGIIRSGDEMLECRVMIPGRGRTGLIIQNIERTPVLSIDELSLLLSAMFSLYVVNPGPFLGLAASGNPISFGLALVVGIGGGWHTELLLSFFVFQIVEAIHSEAPWRSRLM